MNAAISPNLFFTCNISSYDVPTNFMRPTGGEEKYGQEWTARVGNPSDGRQLHKETAYPEGIRV